MRLSFDPVEFSLWTGVGTWAFVMTVLTVLIFVTTLISSIAAMGFAGPWHVLTQIFDAIVDLVSTSPRRCWAITQLTFREALRRKILLVFVVFAVLFLFAGWFMGDVSVDPDLKVKTYIAFVLRTISWLILPVALLLSCWGLPEDIKARSLHTVVTKPVRRHEIVIGRIIGYASIGGVILGVMSVVGWLWIIRQLPPTIAKNLKARVPVYGTLSFLSTEGTPVPEGVNTGDENMFRSFIEGHSKARAIWTFSKIDPKQFSAEPGLVLESSFDAFRTFKGKMDRQLMCQFTLVNDEKRLRVPLNAFEISEFRRNAYAVSQKNPTLQDEGTGKPVELAELLEGGTFKVEAACLSSSQFLGMARPDLFIKMPERSFESSYFKSILNIALMMVMVVVLGVTSSCFLKGPIATVLTLFIVVIGKKAYGFLDMLVTGNVNYHNPHVKFQGAGPFGALYRILTHTTPGVPFDDTFFFRTINKLDSLSLNVLWAVAKGFPNFESFDTAEYTANSFDVPWAESLLPSLATTVAYCIPWILVGYFSLRVRELESK